MNKERGAYVGTDLTELYNLVRSGLTYKEVGEKIGRTECAVRSQWLLRRKKMKQQAATARAGKKSIPKATGSRVQGPTEQTTLVEFVINSTLDKTSKLALLEGLL